ncbi:hypothetical protein GCM10023094_19610 [Rhodococcus olei]|uniref:Carbon monoxide dehydrogenase subunit G n=1 Tax=Rhodococcus olei TaxID=2161675 RepID=A0ABP8NXQ9_9NOCA
MKLAHHFTVDAPIETAWATLTDLEAVAPLLPGARLTGRDGDAYLGTMTVKVGPVTSEFAGRAAFAESDHADHRAVIEAKGKDSRGAGNAAATITARLVEEGGRTTVTVDTDMKIIGKLAQFGSGVLAQVSEKLMNQFADALEAKLAAGGAAAAGGAGSGAAAGAESERASAPEPEAIDLVGLAGPALARRLLPVLAGVAAGVLACLLVRRLRRRSGVDE